MNDLVAGAFLSGVVSAERVLNGTISAGPIVAGDYTISLSDIPNGHRLTVVRGGQEQSIDIMSASLTELDSLLSNYVQKHQGTEHVGKVMKVDANGDLNLSPFYSITANDQGGNTLTL